MRHTLQLGVFHGLGKRGITLAAGGYGDGVRGGDVLNGLVGEGVVDGAAVGAWRGGIAARAERETDDGAEERGAQYACGRQHHGVG